MHYPLPVYKQKAYEEYSDYDMPASGMLQSEILSIPISPVMSDEAVEYVVDCINAFT